MVEDLIKQLKYQEKQLEQEEYNKKSLEWVINERKYTIHKLKGKIAEQAIKSYASKN